MHTYLTTGGIEVTCAVEELPVTGALDLLLARLDDHRGAVFASGYEYPGRYSRWDIGFVDPPVEVVARGRDFTVRALNERGRPLLQLFRQGLEGHAHLSALEGSGDELRGQVAPMPAHFPEEERSKQPTIFSLLRALVQQFGAPGEPHLGFYGAMGYDLVFQFEPIDLRHQRPAQHPDLYLFLPDELIVVDHRKEQARRYRYDFRQGPFSTHGLAREGQALPGAKGKRTVLESDHAPGEYADKVRQVIAGTRRGDFFEVVPSQVLSAGFSGTPSDLFANIRRTNPSPYEFLINLGREQLVGASPEMFVRVEGAQVETCPISGTIRRGASPIEDADQILALLNSEKDAAELTMCTDVDRNDKARVCKAGSVRVLGRRLIETYSRLIHTVDHVVGELRPGFDAFDALLSHMWAVTLTGAPKPAAMQMIERLENSARRWYGGCVGMLLFNGSINTGITIRTVHLEGGEARVRVGATLLCDSDPDEEERETRTKAEAFTNAVLGLAPPAPPSTAALKTTGAGRKVLFVDNRDSFVHTLGDYVRQTGAEVTTLRAGFPYHLLDELHPDLVFISPGPGTPEEFGVPELVRQCVQRRLPVFGVCLGLQGMVEAFGGKLGVLGYPMHGKSSVVQCSGEGFLEGFPARFVAGRYHSLFAIPEALPACLKVQARTEEGVIMAVEHESYPAAAVQFHPESILTLKEDLGLKLIARVVERLAKGCKT
ncbi:MAG: anthranilate synthase component I [Candidatus Latescibacteria bacterium]|nr:anthranilate synthase component I [Candidatus Latescibacterota bacterium]